jgi:hypothetical protein
MMDYRRMSPCERVAYYRKRIRLLTPPRSTRENLLIETFRAIVQENEILCRRGEQGRPPAGAAG